MVDPKDVKLYRVLEVHSGSAWKELKGKNIQVLTTHAYWSFQKEGFMAVDFLEDGKSIPKELGKFNFVNSVKLEPLMGAPELPLPKKKSRSLSTPVEPVSPIAPKKVLLLC